MVNIGRRTLVNPRRLSTFAGWVGRKSRAVGPVGAPVRGPLRIPKLTAIDHLMSSSGSSRPCGSDVARREFRQADVRDGPAHFLRAMSELSLGVNVTQETRTYQWTKSRSTTVEHGDVSLHPVCLGRWRARLEKPRGARQIGAGWRASRTDRRRPRWRDRANAEYRGTS